MIDCSQVVHTPPLEDLKTPESTDTSNTNSKVSSFSKFFFLALQRITLCALPAVVYFSIFPLSLSAGICFTILTIAAVALLFALDENEPTKKRDPLKDAYDEFIQLCETQIEERKNLLLVLETALNDARAILKEGKIQLDEIEMRLNGVSEENRTEISRDDQHAGDASKDPQFDNLMFQFSNYPVLSKQSPHTVEELIHTANLKRAHHAELIASVEQYLKDSYADTNELKERIEKHSSDVQKIKSQIIQ